MSFSQICFPFFLLFSFSVCQSDCRARRVPRSHRGLLRQGRQIPRLLSRGFAALVDGRRCLCLVFSIRLLFCIRLVISSSDRCAERGQGRRQGGRRQKGSGRRRAQNPAQVQELCVCAGAQEVCAIGLVNGRSCLIGRPRVDECIENGETVNGMACNCISLNHGIQMRQAERRGIIESRNGTELEMRPTHLCARCSNMHRM